MRSALALAALAALLVRSAADAGDVLVSPDVLARASSALRGALRQVGALLAEHAHPECQRTPVSSSGGGSNGSYPQAFSHIYPNTTNVYRYARSRRDNKDITYLGSFLKLEDCENAFRNFSAHHPVWYEDGGIQCRSFTYFSHEHYAKSTLFSSGTAEWAGQCFAVGSERWERVPQEAVSTGRICLMAPQHHPTMLSCLRPDLAKLPQAEILG